MAPEKRPKKRRRIQVSVPLNLYDIDLKTFLESNPNYIDVNVACFVFYPPLSDRGGSASNAASNVPFEPAQLLLMRRDVLADEFPHHCEVPSGTCTLKDATILESAKRVLLERTGLHTERLLCAIGEGLELKNDENTSLRLSFENEVAEIVNKDFRVYNSITGVPINLDKCEYRESVWVTKQDIQDDVVELVPHQSKDVILQAFWLRQYGERLARERADMESKAQKLGRRIESKDKRRAMDAANLLKYGVKENPKEKEDKYEDEYEAEDEYEEDDTEDETEGIMERHLRREFRELRESSQG